MCSDILMCVEMKVCRPAGEGSTPIEIVELYVQRHLDVCAIKLVITATSL